MSLDPIKEKIITARVSFLLKSPFYGALATRLIIKESDEWCQTAATDGRHIYYNRAFFEKLSVAEIQFVFAHEILHNVFDHIGRRESRNPKIHNIACDYCVNGQLIRDSIGKPPDLNIFHDKKYYGMGSEEIYDLLMEDADKDSLDALGELLDQHYDWSKDDGTGKPTYTKEELRQIRDDVREATMQAAQAAGAGNTPGMVARMINDLTTAKMNWRELIRQQIQSTIKNDYSFMRPSRKGQHLSAILPGSNYDTTIDICVSIDMSGSISNAQAHEFLSEIKGIMEEYRDFKIKVFCFDTRVYNEQNFDEYSMDEFERYQPEGGGGTDFECMWNHMVESDYTPAKFICFTDMWPCGKWCPPGMENYCDTLWIGHGTTTIVPPFGEYAYFDEA